MEMSSSPLFTPLTRRPDARTVNVRELLEKFKGVKFESPTFSVPSVGKTKMSFSFSIASGEAIRSVLFYFGNVERNREK